VKYKKIIPLTVTQMSVEKVELEGKRKLYFGKKKQTAMWQLSRKTLLLFHPCVRNA